MTDGCYCITAAGNLGNSISSQLGMQLLLGQPVRNGKGRRYGPSITYKTTPARSLPSSQAGGQPCWASPLAFDLIGCTYIVRVAIATKIAITIAQYLYVKKI